MHIEIGILSQDKLAYAGVAATAVLGTYAPALVKSPTAWLRTALAALFFSALMQAFHMKVGPSELHFVGAMPVYLLFGFVPTLFGFGLGLLLQALLFEPQDLVHLAVNFLSLAVPLLVLHHSLGAKLRSLSIAKVLQLDAVYYAGVTLMVGFWLACSQVSTPVADWARFAASYLSVVVIEPLLTMGLVLVAARARRSRVLGWCVDERLMQHAGATAPATR
jgi:ABC-type Co2+ transport system permease subunit